MSSSTERDVWLVGTVLWLFDGRIRLRPSVTSQKSRLSLDSSRPLKVASATLVMVRPVMPSATGFSNCNMLQWSCVIPIQLFLKRTLRFSPHGNMTRFLQGHVLLYAAYIPVAVNFRKFHTVIVVSLFAICSRRWIFRNETQCLMWATLATEMC